MLSRSSILRTVTVLVIAALLLNTLAPAALAQDGGGGNIFLPAVSGGQSASVGDPLPPGRLQYYRTSVEVNTAAQWQSLARIDPVIVERGDNWALLLVDDQQLADLARLRFNPANTNALTTLDAAARSQGGQLPMALTALADQVHTAAQMAATDQQAASAQRAALRSQAKALTSIELSALAAAARVDTDADGLTDDQEAFWCTDPTRPDSDGDGTKDGAEVAKLKDWLNNKLSQAPSTRKPFVGWPNQTTCLDDDFDSIPDAAEWNELGLRGDTESTDFDKFDDGEELFGVTKCPGGSNNCGYGDLPRSADAGFVGADMPTWVKAPGNHPLVAAYPSPEIDVVQSSLWVEPVTVITTEKGTMTQSAKTYSTSKTEGTSSSVADTITWNDWQETSETTALIASSAIDTSGSQSQQALLVASSVTENSDLKEVIDTGTAAAWDICDAVPVASNVCKIPKAIMSTGRFGYAVYSYATGTKETVQSPANGGLNGSGPGCNPNYQSCVDIKFSTPQQQVNACKPTVPTQDRVAGAAGSSYEYSAQSGTWSGAQTYQLEFPLPKFAPYKTVSKGSSHGGAQTTTHSTFEEHTVTNGEQFTSGEDWRTATAVDAAHAADLRFTYTVRNAGTEYAREIANLIFNIYIENDSSPAFTYSVGPDIGGEEKFVNFRPDEVHQYTSRRLPLNLSQMEAIDLGGTIRIVVEDYSYGSDEFFYQRAVQGGILLTLEDGIADGDETIERYLVPTWQSNESILNVLARYFPHDTDLDGNLVAIWTPEYRSDNPSWCHDGWRPSDYPSRVLWCKHTLSTADWWNVYTDGLGNGADGFQDTPAVPGATVLVRFNQDSDLDGFSDRTEIDLGTDEKDASSRPQPELVAGIHNLLVGSKVASTLSLLNRGAYDAYGVEAVMIAPDDSITINSSTVGGSGRVRAFRQIVVGSRTLLPSPLPTPWSQVGHSMPAVSGYFTGTTDAIYTFTVADCPAGGCEVGKGTWILNWSGGGAAGRLNFDAGYKSPLFQPVSQGVMLALYSGNVQNGDTFTVNALTPRDTFQYTINRDNYTPPIVIVSYNDPQGNHRFVVPSNAMNLVTPTDDLRTYAGQMLDGVGINLVTSAPFAPGANSLKLLVNNPSSSNLQNAHLFLEFINMTGTVVSEVPTQVNLPPGPTYTTVNWNSSSFNPPYNPQEDYIVMAFLTDYQGNILDTAGRPLSSFQPDPLPKLAYDPAALIWNFGTVTVGALIKRPLALANTGFGALSVYLGPAPGLTLSRRAEQVGGADLADYELQLSTHALPVGAYDQSVTIATSDPTQPLLTLRVLGNVTAATGDSAGGTVQHPLDALVSVPGDHSLGEWYEYTHALGPDPQTLHPVKVYNQNGTTMYGVGKYATDFGQGTAAYDMFGDGRDGVMPGSGNLDNNSGAAAGTVSGTAGTTGISVTDRYGVWRIQPGDVVLIHQTRGSGAGHWELNKAADDFTGSGTFALQKPLKYTYITNGGNERAQILRVPQYSTCSITGTVTPLAAWNGDWGGLFAVMCSGRITISGMLDVTARGFRGTSGCEGNGDQNGSQLCWTGEGYSGPPLQSQGANGNGGGGGFRQGAVQKPAGGSGGHAASGTTGGGGGGGQGGLPAGDPEFTTLFFGGGGGGGVGDWPRGNWAGSGGNGGGIALLIAREIEVNGSILASGGNGGNGSSGAQNSGGPGGAGGAVYMVTGAANLGNKAIVAFGGAGGKEWQGNESVDGPPGSVGRIRTEYCESATGTTDPPYSSQKLNCYVAEQVESSPYTGGRLNLPETFTGGRTYAIQYGRKLDFAAAGQQLPSLRIPAGLQSSISLQLLASGLAGSTAASIDVGNDGSVEWSDTVANNSTTDLPDLSTAFNAYWAASGAPATGTIDVPVKVASGGAGQFLLTNLRTTSAASRLRHLYLPAQSYTKFLLDLSVGDAGQSGVTAAIDLGDNGSIDWHTPAAGPGPARWTTGDLAGALNTYLAGKSGTVDVPLRIYVSPSGSATLNGYTAAAAPLADLVSSTPTVGLTGAVAGAGTSAASVNEGATVRVSTTLRNNGSGASGPLTAAFFAAVPNWGDWYLGSVYVADLAAGGSAPAALDWNTLNFGGVTAVKVVVNPYGTTGETNLANNTVTLPITVVPLHPAPVANFSATPVTGGAPLSVSFTDLTTGDVTSRSWQFGDGGTATVANPSHTYTSMGVYTVTLSAEGPGGSDWERKTAFITVTDQPVAPTAAFVASPTSGTLPLTVQFTDQSSGTITGRQWDFGDGQTSTQQNPSHTFTSVGSYAVSLSVSGPGGAHSKQMPAYITVTPPAPVAAFGAAPTSGTAPLAVQFTDSSTGVITGRSWNFGDGGTSTAQNPSHSYAVAGSYTVALTVTGPGGSDVETKAAYITVAAVPPPPPTAPFAAFFANITSGVAPLTVQFTDVSTGTITGRTWGFGDGGTSTAQNPSHTYTAAGVYDVSLAVTGSGGSDTAVKTAFIHVADTPPDSSVLMSPGMSGTLQLRLGATTVILLLPPGAIDEPVLISAAEVAVPPATGGLRLAGKAFVITAKTQNNLAVTSFKLPYTLVINYADADVGGIDESRLQLHYWSDAQGAWITVPSTVDATNNTITALLDHLTVFALLERAAAGEEHLYLPSLKR